MTVQATAESAWLDIWMHRLGDEQAGTGPFSEPSFEPWSAEVDPYEPEVWRGIE